LTGPAKEKFAGTPRTADMYDPIVERLKRDYGDGELLRTQILLEAHFYPICHNYHDVRKLVIKFEQTAQFCERTDPSFFQSPAANTLLIALASSKLTQPVRLKYQGWLEQQKRNNLMSNVPIPRHMASAPCDNSMTFYQFLHFVSALCTQMEKTIAGGENAKKIN
jgi:hypothetical protein